MLSLIQNLVQLVLVLRQPPFKTLFTRREDEEEMMDEVKQERFLGNQTSLAISYLIQ